MKEDYIFVKEETFLTRFCEDLLVPQRSLYVSPVNLTEVEVLLGCGWKEVGDSVQCS